MDSLKRIMRYKLNDAKKGLSIFLGILLLLDIFGYFANSYFTNIWNFGLIMGSEISMVAGNLMTILVFFTAYSYSIYYEIFPIVISFSITRKDFYKSFLLNNVLVVLAIALFQGILFRIEPFIVRSIGMNPIQDFVIFNTETDSLIYIVFIMFSAFLAYASLWNLVAALNYKFGYKFWIAVTLIIILTSFLLGLNYAGIFGWINSIFSILSFIFSASWINYRFDLLFIIVSGVFAIACYIISYFVIIRTNVKHKVV